MADTGTDSAFRNVVQFASRYSAGFLVGFQLPSKAIVMEFPQLEKPTLPKVR
jgi:hypothetical protein